MATETSSKTHAHRKKKDPAVVYRKVLESMGAKSVWHAREDVPREKAILQMVDEIAHRRGVSTPPVLIYDSDKPNAVSMPGAVAVATDLIDITTPLQLKAVLGHEMSHTRHRWRDTTMLVAITVTAYALLDALMERITRHFNPKNIFTKSVDVVARDVAPEIGALLAFKPYGQHMEYEADREGAEIAGPDAMAGALGALQRRVDDIKRTQPPKSWLQRVAEKTAIVLLDIHPPMHSRLERMQRMKESENASNTQRAL